MQRLPERQESLEVLHAAHIVGRNVAAFVSNATGAGGSYAVAATFAFLPRVVSAPRDVVTPCPGFPSLPMVLFAATRLRVHHDGLLAFRPPCYDGTPR
jgi:hypothetical protein